MTQAFNLALLANNVNSAGKLNAAAGLYNATPVANGGTGLSTLTANSLLVGAGTANVTLIAPGTNGNALVSNGTAWQSIAPPYAGNKAQVFTSSSTFTIPSSVTAVKVTVAGAGGGGGGAPTSCGLMSGDGGRTGGLAVSWLTGLTPGNTIIVTIGAGGSGGGAGNIAGYQGGTSSVSSGTQAISTISATGGGGGEGGAGAIPSVANWGSGSGGVYNTTTACGSSNTGTPPGYGAGDDSVFGRGAPGQGSADANGQNASGPAAGGGGGVAISVPAAGGTGGTGIVIFEW